MVALLKQAGLPFVLVDNAATSSLIHQYSESYRSWFSDIFLIRSGRVWDGLVLDTSSTEYAFCRLFSSEGGVCDGLDGAVVSTDTTKPVDIRVAITTTATTPAASTPATIPAPSPIHSQPPTQPNVPSPQHKPYTFSRLFVEHKPIFHSSMSLNFEAGSDVLHAHFSRDRSRCVFALPL